jgi:hypothetical protein
MTAGRCSSLTPAVDRSLEQQQQQQQWRLMSNVSSVRHSSQELFDDGASPEELF